MRGSPAGSMSSDTTAAPSCAVCANDGFRAAFLQHGHRFEACRTCGFVRMADPPAPGELRDEYRVDRAHGETVWQEHDKFVARFATIVARIEKHGAKGRLLDIGCSYGASLLAARARGWETSGIELSEPAVEYGRREYGLDIRCATLAEAGFAPGSFDAILMHHTLEHVVDPDVLLAQAHTLLVPGGVMYQALPNYGALKRRALGACWGYGITPNHVAHFTPRTLRRLLQRLGYSVLDVFTDSFREDPRFLHDLMRRFGLVERFMAKRGKAGQPFDAQTYIDWLHEKRWAWWACNRMWPARAVRALGLGEELHAIARR